MRKKGRKRTGSNTWRCPLPWRNPKLPQTPLANFQLLLFDQNSSHDHLELHRRLAKQTSG